ncbi:TetR/AcrR family transcriptional regulator [Nocardia pseudovaccinii]|uniref:TetR/AcrR family transcriptional regulator n=1 Tax=Nocardia pseudovaccinii TaxID=189540 RepID=UPI0007A44D0E|nr:TetR/AcrR family transcriptional regulator [Nocardia pseudovaccinii]
MGTRDDLLAAAKQCLAERGYARTTVRDIVAASGTNLAAINYHFGTRDKLLNQAMMESSADAVQQILDSLPARDAADPAVRLQDFLQQLITSFTEDHALWTANGESLAQALHSPELRAELGSAQERARTELSGFFGPAAQDARLGALLQTMIGGLLIQHLIDPANAPTATDITAGLHTLATLLPTDGGA